MTTTNIPTEEQVLGWFDSLSNWGRWGDDDELGTLNLISEAKRQPGCRPGHRGHQRNLLAVAGAGDGAGRDQHPAAALHGVHRRIGAVRRGAGAPATFSACPSTG